MSREDGFTLPEVLVASLVGVIVLAAILGLLESTVRLSGGVMAKTDAMQRGRLAMDRVTQQLRSQVCLGLDTPAVVQGDERQITFYADFGAGADPVQKRVLRMDPTTGNITEAVYFERQPLGPPYAFPAAPDRTNLLLENAAPQPGRRFLTYYAFSAASRQPDAELPAALTAATAARVARIDVAFVSRPTRARTNAHGVHLEDRVVVRHADPNLSVPDPACA